MKPTLLSSAIITFALVANTASANVTEQQAAELGRGLTPVGAERAGNAAGTIPEWTGGLPTNAAEVTDGFHANPYAEDRPLFIITAANFEQYRDQLAPGQIEMFQRYPDTFRMRVFESRRSVGMPKAVYEATQHNLRNTRLVQDGNGLANYRLANAFPIPSSGIEVLWNHITRWRGGSLNRIVAQATPQVNGNYSLVKFVEQYVVPEALSDYDPRRMDNILYYYKQQVTDPGRLAGNVLLVHETIDQVKSPRNAWIYNAGQRRVRRAPQVSYDGPGTAADGMRTSDNLDLFNGAPDRYNWELVGKREMFIAYNSYELASPEHKYSDIIQAGHINSDLTRYELHRVWQVNASVKPGQRHIYVNRNFFMDEDTWQAAHIDQYDSRGNLWRVTEAHAMHRFDAQVPGFAVETLYDLQAGRYLVMGMTNEERHGFDFNYKSSSNEFTPAALRQSGVR